MSEYTNDPRREILAMLQSYIHADHKDGKAHEVEPARLLAALDAVDPARQLLRDLLDNDDVQFFPSAAESGGPSYMDLEEWHRRVRAIIPEPPEAG